MTEKPAKDLDGSILTIKITELAHIYNCVVNSVVTAGISLTNGADWTILWTGNVRQEIVQGVNPFQRINHFPGTMQIGRKDFLWRNIS